MKIASHSNGSGVDHVGTCPIHYFLPPYMTSDASGGHLLIPLEIWRLTAYCRHRKSMSAIQTQTEKGSGFSARLPQPSSDLDDPPAQLPPSGSASSDQSSHQTTPSSYEKYGLVPTPDVSVHSSNAELHDDALTQADETGRSTSCSEDGSDRLEPALPTERTHGFNLRGGSRMAVNHGSSPLLDGVVTSVEVRMTNSHLG